MKPVDTTNHTIDLHTSGVDAGSSGQTADSEMPALVFLKKVTLWVFAGVLVLVGINVWLDIYGLFRPVAECELPVYYNERVSKFLLSYHYIPEKFNTAIVGTSLSANLDVKSFNERVEPKDRIYNASLMGANISEITPLVHNLVDGGVKKMIICFSPYMIKNSGSKEVEFGPKLYAGAFGSKNLYETYAVGLIRNYNLMPSKFPKNQIDAYGVNHFADLYKVNNVKEKIAQVLAGNKEQLTEDSVALAELKQLITFLRKNNVDFVGYFHPVPAEFLVAKRDSYLHFENTVRSLVQDDTRIVNFNTTAFEPFTTDYSNYIDHGHLSVKGQGQLLSTLLKEYQARVR